MCPRLAGLHFERMWRSLAGHPEQQAQYLLLLRPEQLPTLLKASLTAPLLASLLPPLLSLLAEDCDADHAVRMLGFPSRLRTVAPLHLQRDGVLATTAVAQ
jgi:Potential Monad-binding region of RPAP3